MADNNYTWDDVAALQNKIDELVAKKEKYQQLSYDLETIIDLLESAKSEIRNVSGELAQKYQDSKRSSAISKALLEQYNEIDGILGKVNATKNTCASQIRGLGQEIAIYQSQQDAILDIFFGGGGK